MVQTLLAMNDKHDYPLYNKTDHTARVEDSFLTRREWLEKTGTGFGALALSTMCLSRDSRGKPVAEVLWLPSSRPAPPRPSVY